MIRLKDRQRSYSTLGLKHYLLGFFFIVYTLPIQAQVYDIEHFGAIGDGHTNNTKAVQQAIDECSKTGGTVIFPSGVFATGTVFLKSNVTIHLSEKAVWQGYPGLSAFPDIPPNEPSRMDVTPWKAMVYAFDQENIAISGPGTFYPQGEHEVFQNNIVNSMDRPYGLHIVKCRNVKITGLQMKHSAFWMARFLHCDRLRISGIHIFNHANLNNDGLDIDGCKDVIVSDCHIDSSDDALCFKSEGNRICEDVVVTNCILSSHASALKWGTGSIGGFRNFAVSNIVIRPSKATKMIHPADSWIGLNAIDLGNVDGGSMKDIAINNVMIDSIETPLFVRLGARKDRSWLENGPYTDGYVENITFSNITATNCGNVSSSITGYPGNKVKNVRLHNVFISTTGRGTLRDTTTAIVEPTTNYPINRMFNTNLPAYGLYVRHVEGLLLDRLTLDTTPSEPRSALFVENVDDLEVFHLRGKKRNRLNPYIQLKDVKGVNITGDSQVDNIRDYLWVKGATSDLTLVNNRFSHLQTPEIPLNFKAESRVDKTSYVYLSWEKTTEDGDLMEYILYRDGTELARTRNTSFYDQTADERIEYTYGICAHNTNQVYSEKVKVTVKTKEDKEPAYLESLEVVDGNTLMLRFSEPLDATTIEKSENYAFTPSLVVNGASLGKKPYQLIMKVGDIQPGIQYELTLKNIRDLSFSGNKIKEIKTRFTDQPLVAHWSFDEGRGSVVKDKINGLNGTAYDPTWMEGIKGKAIQFNGESTFVRIPHHELLNIPGNMAIAFWMKLADPELGVYSRIINKREAWNAPHGYELEYNPAKNRFNISGASQTGTDQGVVIREVDAQWHHVVAMIKEDKAMIYLDGENIGVDEQVIPAHPSDFPLTIGATFQKNEFFKGILDEIMLFKRALTGAEILKVYQLHKK